MGKSRFREKQNVPKFSQLIEAESDFRTYSSLYSLLRNSEKYLQHSQLRVSISSHHPNAVKIVLICKAHSSPLSHLRLTSLKKGWALLSHH